jgi:hypothetical protein
MRALRRRTVTSRRSRRLIKFARFYRDEIRIFLLEVLLLGKVKHAVAGNILYRMRAKPGYERMHFEPAKMFFLTLSNHKIHMYHSSLNEEARRRVCLLFPSFSTGR